MITQFVFKFVKCPTKAEIFLQTHSEFKNKLLNSHVEIVNFHQQRCETKQIMIYENIYIASLYSS